MGVLFMRFEILRAVLSKIQIFWDIMLCQMVNSYCHFVHV